MQDATIYFARKSLLTFEVHKDLFSQYSTGLTNAATYMASLAKDLIQSDCYFKSSFFGK